ncbi:hypothetical protein Ancab_031219 [Ancistrocladus abbreviatus]
MKRQETSRSSSGRRESISSADQTTGTTHPHHYAKAIGCMAGIFQLVSSKYHNRRKFLTFGRKQEKQATTSTKKQKPAVVTAKAPPCSREANKTVMIKEDDECKSCNFGRLSCEVPRSPTIPPEIRRSISFNSPGNTTTATRSPPALVARLMGLDEIPTPSTPAMTEAATEKRRKLLGALEKCDEDLKALRQIIEAVRSAECYQMKTAQLPRRTPPVLDGRSPERTRKMRVESSGSLRHLNFEVKKSLFPSGQVEGSGAGLDGGVKKWVVEVNNEQPSPVSVLDEFARSPPSSSYSYSSPKHNTKDYCANAGRVLQPQQEQSRKKPGEALNYNPNYLRFLDKAAIATARSFHAKAGRAAAAPRSSRYAMIETVNEVCRDIRWGQGREVVKIGLVIQDYIYRDLIDEITREMGCHHSASVPLQTCKRRLCF